MKIKLTLLILFCFTSFIGYSQLESNTKPLYKGKIGSVEYISSLMSRPNDLLPIDTTRKEAKDRRSLGPFIKDEAKGKNRKPHQDDYFVKNRNEMERSVASTPPDLVFDAYQSFSSPTDPSLAVGPNHVMVVFNTGFAIFDKDGNELLGETSPNPAIFPSGGCCDLTVSYDNAADRWILSFLTDFASGAQIAISDGSNPLTSNWFVYTIPQIEDYQKLSVWSDGYYMTDNSLGEDKVWVLERDAMLVGDPNAQIISFDLPGLIDFGFISPQVFNITDDNVPAPGGATVVYMQDDEWNGIDQDHIKVWTIDVDWSNVSNSTVSEPTEIDATPFVSVFNDGDFNNLQQPNGGVAIDAVQGAIMNQAQFRKFDTHNSAVFNFVVDTDGSSESLAGIRWYEFRQDGDNQPWSLYQEGTYTAPDGRHAWLASMAMDEQGNIGMGYTSMSGPTTPTDVFVSSYYTGRSDGDPLGTMTREEQLIAAGNDTFDIVRYGDYSKIDVDPTDDSTFWFITEYPREGVPFDTFGVVGRFQLEEDNEETDLTPIVGYFFESGFEGWTDGGSDCSISTNRRRSFEGRQSIRLRDNSNSSNTVSPVLNLTGNSEISIEFHVFPNSMEPGEDFFVEFFDGSSYQTIGNYASGTDFTNGTFFTDTIILDSDTYLFNGHNRFRFRCDASNNRDRIFIDAIVVSGDNVNTPASAVPDELPTVNTLRQFTDASEENIRMYPNPTRSQLTIDILDVNYDEIIIFSSTGRIIEKLNPKTDSLSVDVSALSSGMYFIRFVSKEGLAVTKRFIKQ